MYLFFDTLERMEYANLGWSSILKSTVSVAPDLPDASGEVLMSGLEAPKRAIESIHGLFSASSTDVRELNKGLPGLRQAYLSLAEQVLELVGDLELRSEPSNRRLTSFLDKSAVKLRAQLTD